MASLLERMMPGAGLREKVETLTEQVSVERDNNGLLQESIAQLQLALEDVGWVRALAVADQEFSRDGLRQMTAACRLYSIKNPLVKRGLTLRQIYVWGQGVEITARSNGRNHAGEQDVNTVIQQFLDDPDNRRTLTGADAQTRCERSLGTDGNIFIALWTRPLTGRVQARLLPWDEIDDIVTNPQDSSEPWYYHRKWTETTINPDGTRSTAQREAYYPAIGYRPRTRPRRIGPAEVRWDAPVRHVRVNDIEGWKFGVPDAYAAIDWARAYKEFLEDWAKLIKSLSRFAWKATTPGSKAAAVKTRMATAPATSQITGEPQGVGATALLHPEVTLEAIPKSGATIDSESGRPLAAMVAAALGVPVTMLLGDPGVTGSRATAETLDQPTELEMESRRQLWSEVLRDVCEYVIREAVRAPQGPLKGVIGRDEYDRETVALAGDTAATVDVVWPDLKDLDPAGMVEAIAKAASTGTVPPELILRLLLSALGVQHIDEIVDELVDEEGNFRWPNSPPIGSGQAAVNALNAGEDPAATGDGPMTPDNEDDEDDKPPAPDAEEQ